MFGQFLSAVPFVNLFSWVWSGCVFVRVRGGCSVLNYPELSGFVFMCVLVNFGIGVLQ
jgi:hypothetical protein